MRKGIAGIILALHRDISIAELVAEAVTHLEVALAGSEAASCQKASRDGECPHCITLTLSSVGKIRDLVGIEVT